MRACAPRPPCPHSSPGLCPPGGESGRSWGPGSGERGGPTGGPRGPAGRDACWYWRLCRVEKITGRPGRRCLLDPGRSPTHEDLKEKKEVVEEAENGRDAPANGNAENEENGEQEADNEVDEEEEEGGEEEEEEEEGDGEEEDGDEDEEAESATGKRAAEDDEDDDVDTKKQKTDEDD
uniref:prothymosin alpha isoform X2 n=1 Tax=Macaca mulatta TaxID=9544 RepID=UPI000D2F8FEF|nr:prothymosin alpha isoform X1 [Macaca nemestrina]XP_028687049.1 prothymosin alpha isoform X2 [Macaca mulatta]XP_045223816.1 prothymosin alpha isoform X2 [Macaca fascicularis]